MSEAFEPGELVLLIDQRDRTYLLRLEAGGTFHTHGGALLYDEVVGTSEGARLETSKGMVLVAFRPRMADLVVKMPRGAQVVYPKDLGAIVTAADVFPGARVVEAGTGSGSLTIALCRAAGPDGRVVSYEVRDEHADTAVRNVETAFGKMPDQLEVRRGDLAEVATTGEAYDRAVLDLPEPWVALEALAAVLEPGGIVCAYVPTTIQVQRFVLAVDEGRFRHIETFETLKRGWHVTSRSVRPAHRMVGHTGFLSVARRLG